MSLILLLVFVICGISTALLVALIIQKPSNRAYIVFFYIPFAVEILLTYMDNLGQALVNYPLFPVTYLAVFLVFAIQSKEPFRIRLIFLASYATVSLMTHQLCILSVNHLAL